MINENIFENFKKETSMYKEAGHFYSAQGFNETIHNQVYGISIETVFYNEAEKLAAFTAIHSNPTIKVIADWVAEWMNPMKKEFIGMGEKLAILEAWMNPMEK